ncbi:MAG: hypothetical protein WKG07_44125 [Hymenobacter sp.]
MRSQGLEACSSALRLRQGRHRAAARVRLQPHPNRKRGRAAVDTYPVGVQLAYVPLHRASLSTDHAWRGAAGWPARRSPLQQLRLH